MEPTSKKPVIKTILIKNTTFVPALVKCSPNTIIRWIVQPDKERNNKSLYYDTTRGHVIGFDDLPIESGFLPTEGCFDVQFHQPGTYEYKCLIFPSMKGAIEITKEERHGNISAGNEKAFTIISSESIVPKSSPRFSIKEIVQKYLRKANRNLSPTVELELNEAETSSKLEIFEGQHAIFKELLSMNMDCIWKKAEMYKKTNAQLEIEAYSRKSIISNCMSMY